MNASIPHASIYENPARTHGFEPLRVEGELPEGLAGTLYRCGPGLIERFGRRLPHPFEADGVVTAVRLDGGGGAQGAVRVLEGPDYATEEAAGRYLHGSGASWPRRVLNMLRGRVKNTGNTRAWVHGDRVFALMEAAKPLELDPATLEVQAETDLDGAVIRTFSAHPHRVDALGTSFNFGQRYGGKDCELDLYELPDRGPARRLASVASSGAGMIHDFVVTERHALFFNCPARLSVGRALFQIGDFSSWFRWQPQEGTEVIVVPLADPGATKRFVVEPFWVWHIVNGFERGDEIVVDYCRYPDLGSLAAIAGGPKPAPPRLHRATLDLGTGRWHSEERWAQDCEFPRVDPRFEGREHQRAWFYTGAESTDAHDLARLDVDTGAVDLWVAGSKIRPSEPVPAPRRAGDEGMPWILSLCHDEPSDTSFVAVLDGGAMAEGPVAKLWFDHTIPQTFHGDWQPAQP